MPADCHVTPSAEVMISGCWIPPDAVSPTAIQPAGPCATPVSFPAPDGWEAGDTSAQAPSAPRRQIAGWPSAAPTASCAPSPDEIELTVTVPCCPGYPGNALPVSAAPL